jgi:hypothetical protein
MKLFIMNFINNNTEVIPGIKLGNLPPTTQIICGIPLMDMQKFGLGQIQNTHRSSNHRSSNLDQTIKDMYYNGSINIEKHDNYSQEWVCKECNQFHYHPKNIGCCTPDKNRKNNFKYLLYLYIKRTTKDTRYNNLKKFALSKQ